MNEEKAKKVLQKQIEKYGQEYDAEGIEALEMAIKALEQEPRKGHWEHGRELSRVFMGATLKGIIYEDWHCSNCHCVIEHSIKPKWDYCPNCGVEMEGDNE